MVKPILVDMTGIIFLFYIFIQNLRDPVRFQVLEMNNPSSSGIGIDSVEVIILFLLSKVKQK